jgi:aryl sulfotransferase
VRTWWEARDLDNVMLLHFNELKADMEGRMRDIAAFVEVEIDPATWPEIVEYCTFDWMREHSEEIAGGADMIFSGGSKAFLYKGTNGRWHDVLSDDECAEYEAKAIEQLGEECARWLAEGNVSKG